MGFQFERSESIPPVNLLSEVKPQVKAEPIELDNFCHIRIEKFLYFQNFSDNTKRNYSRQLTAFIDWCDKDWQAIRMNNVRRYKEYLEGDREVSLDAFSTKFNIRALAF